MRPLPNVLRPTPDDFEPGSRGGSFQSDAVELYPLGLASLGANLARVPPGCSICPLHLHHFEEEHFLLLDGELVVRELWHGEEDYREYRLRPGELVAYPPGTGIAHRFFNRGEEAALLLAVALNLEDEVCEYPDSGKTLLRGFGVGIFEGPAPEQHFAEARARAAARGVQGLALSERPAHVASLEAQRERKVGQGFGCSLSRLAGARELHVNRDRLPAGARSSPLHWHSTNEELLVVIEGQPTLRQLHGQELEGRLSFDGAEPEELRLEPGDVVFWPAGGPIAHQLRNDADQDAVVVVVGPDRPDDICAFPETGELFVAALGRKGSFQGTAYHAGELD